MRFLIRRTYAGVAYDEPKRGNLPANGVKLKECGASPEEQVFSGSDVHVARILPHRGIADLGFRDPQTVIAEPGVLYRLVCDITS